VPKLVIFRGDAVENELRLAGRPVRIGRDARNDIVLDDKSVSRFHAEVRAEGNTYVIVDLKSRNGVWINGQQAKGKAALAFGAPVTLGAFELALEDDVSTGEFDELAPLIEPSRSGKVPMDQPDRPASGTRGPMRAPRVTKRQIVLWSAAALAILIITLVAVAVIRYMSRPSTNVEVVAPLQIPPSPQVRVPDQPPPPADDPIKSTIERHLAEAQAAQSRSEWATVRERATRILELDPDNQAARGLKRQADAALQKGEKGGKPPQPPVVTPQPAVAEVETPLIPRRPGESWGEYTRRVDNIKVNLDAGKSNVAKGDFALGIARLQLVAAAAKGYQGVEALIADAEMKQRVAFSEAMKYGQDNEKQSPPRYSDALKWYLQAQKIDPNTTGPRERIGPLTERVIKEGTEAFQLAEVFRKRSDNAKAIAAYKKAVDVLPQNHEKRAEAQKWLETLKP
jgi:pSer/pThr/pTyr-binding forkhead associated (FHA) protein/tetratricopeptide (TPR) repeat protein